MKKHTESQKSPSNVTSRRGLFRPRVLAGAAAAAALSGRKAAQGGGATKPLLVTVFLRGGCDMLGPLMPPLNLDYNGGGGNPAMRNFTRGLPPTGACVPQRVIPLLDGSGAMVSFGTPADVWGVPQTCVGSVDPMTCVGSGGVLKPWNDGNFTYVLGVGSTTGGQSHFTKMCDMETMTTPDCTHFDGWIGRSLNALDADVMVPEVRGIATAAKRPKSFLGGQDVIVSTDLSTYSLEGPTASPNVVTYGLAIKKMYRRTDEPLFTVGEATFEGFEWSADTYSATYNTMNNAVYDTSSYFGNSLLNVAKAFVNSPSSSCPDFAHLDLGGFDTHSNEDIFRTGDDALGRIYRDLFLNLEAFYRDMLGHGKNVLVMVMSEFGRRAMENGSEGTDHGKGGIMFLMGQGVKGHRLHGAWNGMSPTALDSNGDFPVLIDYRQVVAEVLEKHMGLSLAQIDQVVNPGSAANCFTYSPIGVL